MRGTPSTLFDARVRFLHLLCRNRHLPFRRILARHVLGPVALQSRDANLVGGDVGGGSYKLRQVVFRPVPKLSPYATPLPGLYLGGASTFPGGAVHGVPGDAAARAALRRTA